MGFILLVQPTGPNPPSTNPVFGGQAAYLATNYAANMPVRFSVAAGGTLEQQMSTNQQPYSPPIAIPNGHLETLQRPNDTGWNDYVWAVRKSDGTYYRNVAVTYTPMGGTPRPWSATNPPTINAGDTVQAVFTDGTKGSVTIQMSCEEPE